MNLLNVRLSLYLLNIQHESVLEYMDWILTKPPIKHFSFLEQLSYSKLEKNSASRPTSNLMTAAWVRFPDERIILNFDSLQLCSQLTYRDPKYLFGEISTFSRNKSSLRGLAGFLIQAMLYQMTLFTRGLCYKRLNHFLASCYLLGWFSSFEIFRFRISTEEHNSVICVSTIKF